MLVRICKINRCKRDGQGDETLFVKCQNQIVRWTDKIRSSVPQSNRPIGTTSANSRTVRPDVTPLSSPLSRFTIPHGPNLFVLSNPARQHPCSIVTLIAHGNLILSPVSQGGVRSPDG